VILPGRPATRQNGRKHETLPDEGRLRYVSRASTPWTGGVAAGRRGEPVGDKAPGAGGLRSQAATPPRARSLGGKAAHVRFITTQLPGKPEGEDNQDAPLNTRV
jgi:hypothetical protein